MDEAKWIAKGVREETRLWCRPKKYKPQHRKRKMLAMRRNVKKMSFDEVLHFMDKVVPRYEKRIRRGASIYLRVGNHSYKAQELFRAIRSIHKDLVRRLSNLVAYW